MIRKGETIECCMCHKEIYRAREDIPPKSPMSSSFLEFMNGEPVPKHAKQACPNCWIMFRSISTETRQTII
jgi:hypothetical protein